MADGTLKFPATIQEFERAAHTLRRTLDAHGVRDKGRYNVELVFDEIVSNIIRHGRVDERTCAIEVSLAFEAEAVVLEFSDNGRAFDPRSHPVPALPESLEEAPIGGLGLMLVRNAAERIEYERTAQQLNRVTITVPTRR